MKENKNSYKNISEIYKHTGDLKLSTTAKITRAIGSVAIPFSFIHLGIGLLSAKSKYKKYEKEGKLSTSASSRYKFIDKLIKRTLNYKRVRFLDFGFDKVLKTPVVFVANHKSNIDALMMLHTVYKHKDIPYVRVVAKQELANDSKFGAPLKLIDSIFVDRSDIRNLKELIKEEIEVIRQDTSLLIFPEGTRVSGDELGEFHSSALEVAFQTYAPIVPICIFGTDGFLAKDGSARSRYDKTEFVIDALEPIKYTQYNQWTRPHLAEVIKQKIQERYDLWKANYEYMHSAQYKRDEKKNPLQENKELHDRERAKIKRKIDN